MLQNYNTYKILQLFFDEPTKNFQLREVSRMTKISLPSVINHISKLESYGFIKKVKKHTYSSYEADMNSDKFKLYKKIDLLLRLNESEMIDYLTKTFVPDVIVLFGSASRGEDIERSDVDLFIAAKEKNVNLKKFEKIIRRKINLLFEPDISKISKELRNNLANGIVLYGYLKVL